MLERTTQLTFLPTFPHSRSQTINNLVEKQPQTWHTTIGLPFRRIEGTVRTPHRFPPSPHASGRTCDSRPLGRFFCAHRSLSGMRFGLTSV